MSLNQNINTVQDYEDVLAAIQGYVNGLKTGNVEELKKTFHKNAIMYGHLGDDLWCGTKHQNESDGSTQNTYNSNSSS